MQEYADQVRKALKADELGERLQIEFNSELVGGHCLDFTLCVYYRGSHGYYEIW